MYQSYRTVHLKGTNAWDGDNLSTKDHYQPTLGRLSEWKISRAPSASVTCDLWCAEVTAGGVGAEQQCGYERVYEGVASNSPQAAQTIVYRNTNVYLVFTPGRRPLPSYS